MKLIALRPFKTPQVRKVITYCDSFRLLAGDHCHVHVYVPKHWTQLSRSGIISLWPFFGWLGCGGNLSSCLKKEIADLCCSYMLLQWFPSKAPRLPCDSHMTVGVSLDPDHAFSVLDMGPPADSKEVYTCMIIQHTVYYSYIHVLHVYSTSNYMYMHVHVLYTILTCKQSKTFSAMFRQVSFACSGERKQSCGGFKTAPSLRRWYGGRGEGVWGGGGEW